MGGTRLDPILYPGQDAFFNHKGHKWAPRQRQPARHLAGAGKVQNNFIIISLRP